MAPFTMGDFSDRAKNSPPYQVKIIANHAMTWWVDHPVKTVMVVAIGPADK